ncbi:phage gateway protein [Vibrio harveyi]|uniref:phage gateway protein n=1 Tax=Vibrio harveyi TaxID=669 RepID=UPI000D785E1F|nr:hypothetical protein [Vibrio harveyi]GBK97744.1 hypothetical protein VH1709_contig00011-0072 [Vibrio harveyi]HDM8061700.1 hypothetical protein [Vibrio harveyi]
MNDNNLFIVLIAIIKAGLDNEGLHDVEVLQGYQPTQQGTPEQKAVFLHKLPSRRYGSPKQTDEFDEKSGVFKTTETFIRLTKIQIQTRVQIDPSDINALTSSDLADTVADILNFSSTRTELLSEGIGIERITDVQNVYEINEKDRFEGIPSFDVTLNYEKTYSSTTPAVARSVRNIHRI